MTWLDEMNALQTKLVEASPIEIGDELFNAMRVFREAHADVLQMGATKIHLSPFWGDAGFILPPPVNPKIVNYIFLNEIAQREGVPVTWLYMMPYKAQIDAAARHVFFTEGDIMYVDDDGNATPNCLMAYHDGVSDGLIDKDEPFIFANTEFTDTYISMSNEALQEMADHQGMSVEMVLEQFSPTHIDSPFPYESDDIPWGEE